MRWLVLLTVTLACLVFGAGCAESRSHPAHVNSNAPSVAAAMTAVKRVIRRDYGPGPITELHCAAPRQNGMRCSFLKLPQPTGVGAAAAGVYNVHVDGANRISVAPSGDSCLGGVCYFTGGPNGQIKAPAPSP
jgi:hypothetical protein